MTLVGIICLFGGLWLAVAFGRTGSRYGITNFVPFFAYMWHTLLCLFYWNYSLSNIADATLYFSRADGSIPFDLGTRAIIGIVYVFRMFTGGLDSATYLDSFLFFNIIGYAGLVLLWKSLRHISGRNGLGMETAVIFLPGLSFWSSAIGKDAITFLAICTIIYASTLKSFKRLVLFSIGLVICFVARPHIAALVMISVGIVYGITRGTALSRLTTIVVSSILIFSLSGLILDYVKLQSIDPESIGSFVSDRQNRNIGGGSSLNISDYPFVIKVFTYLYRPLFFDARNFLGVVVSIENLILATFTFIAGSHVFRNARLIMLAPDYILFNMVFFALATTVLALTTANLGIAIRQKIMVLPSMIIVALWIIQSSKRMLRPAPSSRPAGLVLQRCAPADASTSSVSPQRSAPDYDRPRPSS